jgi:hypothetical protein
MSTIAHFYIATLDRPKQAPLAARVGTETLFMIHIDISGLSRYAFNV